MLLSEVITTDLYVLFLFEIRVNFLKHHKAPLDIRNSCCVSDGLCPILKGDN